MLKMSTISVGDGQQDNAVTNTLLGQIEIEMKRREGVDAVDNVELMLMRRLATKKVSTVIPEPIQQHGSRLGKVYLTDEQFEHLLVEVHGGKVKDVKYDSCRPDLEVHIIGMEHDQLAHFQDKGDHYHSQLYKPNHTKNEEISQILVNAKDQSDGKGLEVLYDSGKSLYILTEYVEDCILLLLRRNFIVGSHVSIGNFLCKENMTNKINMITEAKRRIWRRFVRHHLLHLLDDVERMTSVEMRYNAYIERKAKEAIDNDEDIIRDAADLSSSEDSDDSQYGKKKVVTGLVIAKKKTKSKGKKKKASVQAKGDADARAITPIKSSVDRNATPIKKNR